MKCAKQYIMEKEQTLRQYNTELDLQALEWHVEACANAIKFCETVVDAEFAKQAQNNSHFFNVCYRIREHADRFGNIHFDVVVPETYYRTVHHRNGTKSKKREYRWIASCHTNIDKETFIKYLNNHCYEVDYISDFRCIIKPMPECNE